MSKDKNLQKVFTEEDTKQLVKKILDTNVREEKNFSEDEEESIFNIEYEEYEEYEDEEDDEWISVENEKHKNKYKKIKESKNDYRKNIEKYGKEFFDDDYDDYDDYEGSSYLFGKIVSVSVIIVLTISTGLLSFKLISTKKELKEANIKIEEMLNNIQAENKAEEDSLKSEITSLKKENEKLEQVENKEPQSQPTTQKITTQKTTEAKQTSNNSNNLKSSEYIVKEGDIIWNISKEVYGNGSEYKKILEANGLKEDSILKPGQKLIIPKLN